MQGHPSKLIENPLPVEELLKRAQAGDADCQYWAGIRFFQGEGVPEDPRRAIELCADAADQFHVRAIAFLAYCRLRGVVVPKNRRDAVTMYRFAATEGYAPAQYSLGILYLAGNGVRRSVRLAVKWLGKAAAQSDIDALVRLGDLHHEGKAVVEDEEKACYYYRRAAELGSARGQYMYGSFLMKGVAVAADPIEALDWLDQAAAQGYAPANEVQEYYRQFVRFDPAEAGLKDFPVQHPFPVRRRTAVCVAVLKCPCLQAMAGDLSDYIRENPKDEETGLKDVAALLAAAAENGQPPLTFVQ
ncbi:MAG: sel1 repeat family protein [Desulfuromonas sp.]|nr:sel1 repeat family protein [Desulfuromonas sp.]